ncbi:MAG TPA: hypothetical protein DDZ88_25285, partial [Verrucomicrobiales bacterium]|nr:hypothetical protein [Verrucomicrobiales bacterium]
MANWSAYPGYTAPAEGTPEDPIDPSLPAASRRAVFELLSNGTITFTGSVATADAQVLKGSAFFALGGHTWNTGSSFSILAPFVNAEGLGPEDPPYTGVTVNTTVSGGTLNTSSLLVGAGDYRNVGTLTLSATTLNSTSLQIAQSGTGTLNLTNGSILNTTPASNSAVPIGGQGGSHGTVNVSGGSTWNVGPNGVLHVGGFGGSGTGVLNITSGTVSGAGLNVALNSGITGNVYVNGSSSQLSMSDGIYIGQGGTGTMSISNGGTVSAAVGTNSSVGNTGFGTGSVSIAGAGSSWTAGALTLSGPTSSITTNSDGLLDTRGLFMVQNGADLDIQSTGNLEAQTLHIWQGGTAHLSGTVRANVINVEGAGSTVIQTGNNVTIDNGEGIGILNITSGGSYYGAPTIALSATGAAVATCTVNGSGSLWSLGATYYLGAGGGLGGVTVQSGGTFAATELFIGANTNGVLDVLHNGSTFTSSGSVYVGGTQTQATGNGVTGSLTVQNGASAVIAGQLKVWSGGNVQISGGNLEVGSLHVAGGVFNTSSNVTSAGTLTVTGGGSYSGSNLILGGNGFGGASVSGGGSSIDASQVTIQNGRTLSIGADGTLSANQISIEGGELLNSGSIFSDGTLSVTAGGLLDSTVALEISDTGIHQISVSGVNSEIKASSVNVRRDGMLIVDSGGSVTSTVNAFGGTTGGGYGGQVQFENTASAGGGMIVSHGGEASGASGGVVQFRHNTTAGTGTFISHGATAGGASGGRLQFDQNATAAGGTFTVHGGTIGDAEGGGIEFNDNTTAATGLFTVHGGTLGEAEGGGVRFYDSSTAAHGTFTIHGGTVNGAEGGNVQFMGGSSAEAGVFTANAGGVLGAFSGSVEFGDSASAGDAVITANGSAFTGSLVDGTGGGMILFEGFSSARNATLIANGGTGAGLGGAIIFLDQSRGGEARVQVHGNGRLDISLHDSDEVEIGSLEGSGNVFLGSKTLVLGENGLSTTFSGSVQDDGAVFDFTGLHELGGSLIKIGEGTTTLTGMSTYTGMTAVAGGTLVADLSLNASVLNSASELHVGGGTFELKGLAAAARTQVLDGLVVHSGVSSIIVNNVGASTTLDLSSAGITRQEEGTVDFRAVTGTLGVDAIVKTAQQNDASGILAPWATVNGGAALAANNGSNVIVPYTGYTDVSSTIASNSDSNTRLTGGGVVTLAAATTTIHTLTQNHSGAATVDTAGKTLSTNGILVSPTAAALTIGSSAGSGTLTAVDELVLINHSASELTINANVTGGIAMTTSGNTTLNGANTYTGATNIASGTLVVDGSIAASSGVFLATGATLGGHGSVSSIGGEGTVAPGNSPGIMTATSVDPGGGMDFLFQFTQTGAPNFLSASASGNDVLRLSSLTPFLSALSDDNTITLDFSGLTLGSGDVLLGGFYTDNGGDFFSQIQFADFQFVGLDPDLEILISTVAYTADFGSGIVNGRITQFTVASIGAMLTPASISGTATAVLTV